MFTPKGLRRLAADAEILLRSRDIREDVVDLARRQLRDALRCAEWMEEKGMVEAFSVGPFAVRYPVKGERVRIRSGAFVMTTASKPNRHITRARVVTVHRVTEGHFYFDAVRPAEVTWAGGGGYWCWASLNDVEFLG